MKFIWHQTKARTNLKKHQVTFDEAATVFPDPLSFVFADLDHSEDEERFLIIGRSETAKILVVSHTNRENKTRIISAREATRK